MKLKPILITVAIILGLIVILAAITPRSMSHGIINGLTKWFSHSIERRVEKVEGETEQIEKAIEKLEEKSEGIDERMEKSKERIEDIKPSKSTVERRLRWAALGYPVK